MCVFCVCVCVGDCVICMCLCVAGLCAFVWWLVFGCE